MHKIHHHFDVSTILIILITFVLFAIALFTKGFTHDLLLEAGVFLVSVKLIFMSYKQGKAYNTIINDLDDIKDKLTKN